jgi:predicted O-linked N-acetylglucosamine transferase (SPINDLY family)
MNHAQNTLAAATPQPLLEEALACHRRGELRHAEALYQAILRDAPENTDALHLLGVMACQIGKHEAALGFFERAIKTAPGWAILYCSRGVALKALRQYARAIESFDRAVALDARYADAYYNRANLYMQIKRFDCALADYERVEQLQGGHDYLEGQRLFAQASIFDWSDFAARRRRLEEQIAQGRKAIGPFFLLALSGEAAMQKRAAEIYVENECPAPEERMRFAQHAPREKIRIGYFSPDFRAHAIGYLTAEIFERHDRDRFEIYGFSYGPQTGDAVERRIAAAMDQFLEVGSRSDEQIASLGREFEIDVAIDLAGHTFGGRPKIFAYGAAPVQVSYLGHPGTSGAPYIDYLLADERLIPAAQREFYTEKIAYLPDCFQPTDTRQLVAATETTRADEGLPESGFVYCCFNNGCKIQPEVFDLWMEILLGVEGSVLWLAEENERARNNLRREAVARGLSAERLVFCRRVSAAEHLSRQRLADLFLDTYPFNAGATANSALWAGLPVLTRGGEVFASRMGMSLLHALKIPELIAGSAEQYVERAVALGHAPQRIAELKARLRQSRSASPLYEMRRFTRNLESLYSAMHARAQAGLPAEHLFV